MKNLSAYFYTVLLLIFMLLCIPNIFYTYFETKIFNIFNRKANGNLAKKRYFRTFFCKFIYYGKYYLIISSGKSIRNYIRAAICNHFFF